jgi:hypothetical protein
MWLTAIIVLPSVAKYALPAKVPSKYQVMVQPVIWLFALALNFMTPSATNAYARPALISLIMYVNLAGLLSA